MYIGNVTELILTGNEISSTRGLDRLFSLERLSLDDNNICNLANVAGVAKIPFLMNFDLKGNPLETEGEIFHSFDMVASFFEHARLIVTRIFSVYVLNVA